MTGSIIARRALGLICLIRQVACPPRPILPDLAYSLISIAEDLLPSIR